MNKETIYETQYIKSRNEVLAEIILEVNGSINLKDKKVAVIKKKTI